MCYNIDRNKTGIQIYVKINNQGAECFLTGDRFYDYYGNRTAYAPPERYAPTRRMQMNYVEAAPGGYAQSRRPTSDYAPRRATPRGGYSPTSRRPAQNRPSGQRPTNGAGAPPRRRVPTDARRNTASGRRPVASRRRAGTPIGVKVGLVAAALLLMVVLGFGATRLFSGSTVPIEERFVDNVYVNGVCLTGYTHEDGLQLMHDLRDQWLNTTYTLTFNDRSWEFSPGMVNAGLDFDQNIERAWNLGHVGDRSTRREIVKSLQQVPAEFMSEPTYDESALDSFVAGIASEVNLEPVDAEVTLTEQKPIITQASRNGYALDTEALKTTLVGLIETGKGNLKLPVQEVQPAIASDDMEMDQIVKFQTDVTFRNFDSRSNVRTALNHFNLFTVNPGDTVSFNEIVGPRTEALGFKEAPEYAGSKEEMGIGGGVCQASTTLYNAMIQSGMTIIERHNHTMTVSYVEPSQDAAVNYGKKDFVFRNDTGHPIYIYTDVTKQWATVTVYGTRPKYRYALESIIRQESKSTVVGYQDDLSGKIVYYTTDTPVLYKEGHGSCHSEGWLVSYDWNTDREIERVKVSYDMYLAGVNVYWRGIHNPDGSTTAATEPPSQF